MLSLTLELALTYNRRLCLELYGGMLRQCISHYYILFDIAKIMNLCFQKILVEISL